MLNSCAINKVILMGRITQTPELRQTPSGANTCRFTVAVDRGVNSNTNERQTDFITVNAWDKNAEFATRFLSKGRLVLVEGNLRTGSYDDRNHPDVKHYTCEVMAERISFGETKASAGGQGGGYQQGGYNNNYQQNNYGGQGGYSQPAQGQPAYQQSAPAPSVSVGDLSDFEEVISDSDLPF
ncbi:MAG: single-stranded DNA-binding protein [Huintestinicola sp.]